MFCRLAGLMTVGNADYTSTPENFKASAFLPLPHPSSLFHPPKLSTAGFQSGGVIALSSTKPLREAQGIVRGSHHNSASSITRSY